MQNIILRSEAKSLELKRYFTGKPCKHGHIAERFTATGECHRCSQLKGIVAARNRRISNPELEREKDRIRYKKDNRKKLANEKWRTKNRDKQKESIKNWILKNRKYVNSIHSKHRANKSNATPQWADLDKIKKIYAECNDGYHVDHIVPINSKLVCGLHCEFNLQYLGALENIVKGNRYWPDMP